MTGGLHRDAQAGFGGELHGRRVVCRAEARKRLRFKGADEVGRSAFDTNAASIEQMLDQNARRAPGYWIQLSLAAGIAILGLVLNSTAVVRGKNNIRELNLASNFVSLTVGLNLHELRK